MPVLFLVSVFDTVTTNNVGFLCVCKYDACLIFLWVIFNPLFCLWDTNPIFKHKMYNEPKTV